MTLCFLSDLRVNLPSESKRVGNERVGTRNSSSGNSDRSEVENSSHDTLFDVQPFALCQYQIDRPAADDTCFENHPLVGNGISRTDLNEQPLQERHQPEKQNQ